MGSVRLYARTHDLTTLLKKWIIMIDDLDAAISPAAFPLPSIDVVIRDQVIRFRILGKEIGEALHGKRIVCNKPHTDRRSQPYCLHGK